MIRLYGVVDDAAAAREALARTDGTVNVEVMVAGGLACLAGEDTTADPPAIDAGGLRAHDQVLRRVMTACTVVPFRYGTTVADRTQLEECVRSRRDEMHRLFDRLRGRCELAFRARPRQEAPRPGPPTSGARYLRALGGAPDRSARELHLALAAEAVDSVVEGDGGSGIKASYLVDAAGMDAICDRLAARRTAGDQLVVSLTGPWAPYSFVAEP